MTQTSPSNDNEKVEQLKKNEAKHVDVYAANMRAEYHNKAQRDALPDDDDKPTTTRSSGR
jgi:hypothetical protein